MSISFEMHMKVAFHDLDPLQVVWHGNYLKFFDITRFGLFAASGIDLYKYLLEKQIAFPVTRTSLKYISPLRAFDEFICRATVTEAYHKIGMAFEIRKNSEQLAVRYPGMEMEFPIPEDIRQALQWV
jgi:acyl-CoA thioester hydrolase